MHRNIVDLHADPCSAQLVEGVRREMPEASSFQPTDRGARRKRVGSVPEAKARYWPAPIVAIGERGASGDIIVQPPHLARTERRMESVMR